MPVAGNTRSLGGLQGGASAALAEAIGSWAAMIHASTMGRVCVGVDLNITHHRGAHAGLITGTATALHRGRRMATYDVRIEDSSGELLAPDRLNKHPLAPAIRHSEHSRAGKGWVR